jgi:SRSO17 transposase
LAWLRDLTLLAGQAWGMLAVMEDARVQPGDGHAAWSESFNEMFAQAAGVFGNAAVRRHGRAYLLGLLSHTERKNSWSLAEFAGDVSPDGMQRLLNFSPWDQDACRDVLARYVVKGMGDPAAVLAVDETGFLKKGRMSVILSFRVNRGCDLRRPVVDSVADGTLAA